MTWVDEAYEIDREVVDRIVDEELNCGEHLIMARWIVNRLQWELSITRYAAWEIVFHHPRLALYVPNGQLEWHVRDRERRAA